MNGTRRCLFALAALLVAGLVLAPTAGAESASSLGPLEFFQGQTATIVAPTLTSFSQGITNSGGAGFGSGAGSGSGKVKVTEIHVVKPVDASSPQIFAATAKGTHFSRVAIQARTEGSGLNFCLEDAFIASDQQSGGASDEHPTESFGIVFAKISENYNGPACAGAGSGPSVVSTLIGLGARAATIVARVDCLQPRCAGRLTVGLPGGGFTGSGKFSMGDGSVRVLDLPVPSASRGALRGFGDGSLKTVLSLTGRSSPIVGRAPLAPPPPKKIAGLPALTLIPASPTPSPTPAPSPAPTPTPTPTPTPSPLSQALQIAGCSTPVPGTPPTVIAVTGSLSPARAGVPVSLEFVPTSGPPPLPAPIVDSVLTDAAGNFTEDFDREQGGVDYSWGVTASVAEGGGYLAAASASCAVPIP
ncbi:MAG TPA: type VI secretion system tube protein Hcp [Solirubrobacterales bacterium]